MGERDCPNAAMDITRCMRGAPTVMSSPYFLHSPEYLRTDLMDYPEPNLALHETTLDMEPITGSTTNVYKRIQVRAPCKAVKK